LKRQLVRGRPSQRSDSQIRRDEDEIQDTEEILQDVVPLEVPPLMNTMPGPPGASQQPQFGPDLEFRSAQRPRRRVRRTALEEPLEQSVDQTPEQLDVPQPASEPVALDEAFAAEAEPIETNDSPEPLEYVVVRGDVLPKDGENGPRLLADVEPLGASGGPAEFAGELSLMILDTSGEKPRGIARWDFSPEQLTELLGKEPGPTMEFPLQLPAGTPTDRPLEIWARLVPTGADKVLAHAELHLEQPGPFSSVRPQPVVLHERATQRIAEEEPVPEIANDDVENKPVNFSAGDWNGWQVARPDQLGDVSTGRPPQSQWHKAMQPIPTAVNQGRPVAAAAASTSGADDRVARRAKAAVKPPLWSPERSGNSANKPADVPAPAWSPER
jgi:hypothetical protein